MNFLLKLLAFLYFLIWIPIGAALLFGLWYVTKLQPWKMRQGGFMNGAFFAFPKLPTQILPADLPQRLLGSLTELKDPKKREEAWQRLSRAQQECLTAALGADTVQKFRTDPGFQLDASLLFKASPCVNK